MLRISRGLTKKLKLGQRHFMMHPEAGMGISLKQMYTREALLKIQLSINVGLLRIKHRPVFQVKDLQKL